MPLVSSPVLKTIFAAKGNFAQGKPPGRKVLSGIEVAPFRDHADAAVCISADFEMSWAWRGRSADTARRKAIDERRNIPHILRLLDEYAVPITWATVGHLFLESCTRSKSGRAHADMPRPPVNPPWDGDWYSHDPCSNATKEPLWYAPDLIRLIMQSKAPHEIGTHSFSHINFFAFRSTAELIQKELDACIAAMRSFGLKPRSLVFPHNIAEYSYSPLLASRGITAVRHRDDNVRLSYPERTSSGIYKIYESMNLRKAAYYNYPDKAKIFIQKAIQRQAAYSLWFHPSDPSILFEIELRAILRYISEERNRGRIWVTTMQDLAAYCEAREQVQITADRTDGTLTVYLRSSLDTSKYGTPAISLLIPVDDKPRSASLELKNGERMPLHAGPISGGRLLVNVPTSTSAVQVTF